MKWRSKIHCVRLLVLLLNVMAPAATPAQTGSVAPASPLAEFSNQLARLAAEVAPGVVQVQVSVWLPPDSSQGDVSDVLRLRHIIGSGVIVDPSGYILTNEHVVHNARRVRVLLTPGSGAEGPTVRRKTLDAIVVGVHQESDLALLKIPASGLHALSFSSMGSVHQGQMVLAVGSPEGLDDSLTLGVVSAVGRQSDPNLPMVYIQTDAAINPGNSGGPLLDMRGNVVGVNTFIITESGGNQGLGFAIPAAVAQYVYTQLRDHGLVRRNSIGADVQAVTPDLAHALHLQREDGVVISDITEHGPAQSAGLRVQDLIVGMDGTEISSLPAFAVRMHLHDLSAPMTIKVLREGAPLEFRVPVVAAEDTQGPNAIDQTTSTVPQLGILARVLDAAFANRQGLRSKAGVYVVAKTEESDASEMALAVGDVILSLNGTPVYSVLQLQQALTELSPDDPALLQIEHRGHLLFLPLQLD